MMASFVRALGRVRLLRMVRGMSTDQVPQYGSGAGKGGGSGGTVRESGGAFGVREAVMEEQYFRRLTAQQLDELHSHLTEEIQVLQKQLKELEVTISTKKDKLKQLKTITEPQS